MQINSDESAKSITTSRRLRLILNKAKEYEKNPEITQNHLLGFTRFTRVHFTKIYGENSPALEYFPIIPVQPPLTDVRAELGKRVAHVSRFLEHFENLPEATKNQHLGKRIFIGHGRSSLWRELKDFISDRMGLPWDEFNRESVAGVTTAERLEHMLAESSFAFLIMTAEEEHADASLHARPNVIHEVGLFQGKLGMRRAIVLLEEGCTEFSNITGVSQIRFPRGDIAARFEEIRRVLEREEIVS